MVDVNAVAFGERCTFDKENVLGVKFGASGKIVRTGNDGVVNDEDFVVHEIVFTGRRIRG